MSDIALYYPNMRVRDSTWLKAALLHWPKIARMVPSGEDRRLPVGTAEFFRAWPEDVAQFTAHYDCLLDFSVAGRERGRRGRRRVGAPDDIAYSFTGLAIETVLP